MEKLDIDVNKSLSLTWNFLDVNKTHLEFPYEKKLGGEKKSNEIFKSIRSALGKEFDEKIDFLVESGGASSIFFEVFENDFSHKKKIEFFADENDGKIFDVTIHAHKNCQSEFIFVFKNKNSFFGNSHIGARIRVFAEENSLVKLSTVNMLGGGIVFFNSIGSRCMQGAQFCLCELEMGGAKTFCGAFNHLASRASRFLGRVSYVAKGDSIFDMNYISHHEASASESLLEVDGVLFEKAKKTWRGTIDFKRGCTDSCGNEQEDVLLLSCDVLNKSLPVILCDEESVCGRHGCSIGRLDEKKLFYMQSRGIDENVACEILTCAKVEKTLRFIGDEDVRAQVKNFISKKI